ncbi:hypothetical protein EG240_06915 [Paenimyroides tangerinum]|uniref:Ig-like domain-containing protein n=1 Tax=Paenimyroides tangerinum TaxID=2488728 RepID=A0A3P3WC78_9FLAO|nr:hypothetical protein [Paenimyroides tangerinum]RRJ91229.1 hypothetical protein EG240_06915 [Paenimyroides tangerinum]
MKKLLFLLSIFSLSQTKAQQNLVLNPSFEDTSGPLSCSVYALGQASPIQNWKAGSYASPDFYSSTLALNCHLHPLNPNFANQPPLTGNNYAGIVNEESYYEPQYREYIRGKLSEPLQIGVTYRVQFYICLGNLSTAGSNNIGVKFINDASTLSFNPTIIPLQPELNYSGAPFTDYNNWTLLSFTYSPTVSNLDGFIIGNFFPDDETSFEMLTSTSLRRFYLLIDDVSIFDIQINFNIPNEICQGDELVLPNVSENGVEGIWTPTINNQQTTTYTFTPIDSNLESFEKTIVVNPTLVPDFDEIGPFCDEIPNITELPSISNNGIVGVWSPVFNPNQTGIYTFTPNEELCVEVVTMKVIVDKTPTFDPIEPFCEIDENFSLPSISTNGISGSWSPAFDPYNSQTYTFTRDSGDCMQETTLDVVLYPQLKFEFFSYCNDDTYFVELIANNFSLSEITNIQWLINNSSISETGNKINLSDYSHLLQEVNTIEII